MYALTAIALSLQYTVSTHTSADMMCSGMRTQMCETARIVRNSAYIAEKKEK